MFSDNNLPVNATAMAIMLGWSFTVRQTRDNKERTVLEWVATAPDGKRYGRAIHEWLDPEKTAFETAWEITWMRTMLAYNIEETIRQLIPNWGIPQELADADEETWRKEE